ncbi:reverse transcriptase domain-containing protein, partial [Tanacetum coccineum]
MESQSESTQTVSTLKLLMLKTGDYDLWSMRMEQYLTHTNYALWEVIVNGDVPSVASASTEGPIPPKTVEQKLARKNELKAKSTLLLAIPDEHLLKFYGIKDAKKISQEDANLKLLRSLPSAWNNIALIMRNKPDLDTFSMDDLYNNLKVSTNEAIKTAHEVSTASSQGQASASTYDDDVMFSFFATQSNSPQLDNEDLEQIDTYDLEEIDLKWQVAILTMRVKRFIKKTRRNLNFNGKETIGFVKTKVMDIQEKDINRSQNDKTEHENGKSEKEKSKSNQCMRTRSQSRNSNRQQQQINPTFVEPFNLVEPIENQAPLVVTMDDTRTMAQLLEAPTVGYEDAIVVPEITADNFELKHGLLTLVQNKQFFGHDKEDPHAHIRYFNNITSMMKFLNVSSTSVKLMLFPFSLEGAARIWLEKEPPRSILTWDDLVSKFINKFFPPSKTTNLRNEITRFQQRFDETFYEAWDRFNDLLRACPHHGFSELHQLDTFYNALNSNDQDSLNSAAGGNFLDKMPHDCLRIIESKSKVRNSRNKPVVAKVSSSSSTPGISPDVAELKDMVKALLLDKKSQAPTPVKAVEESCVTCGGAHSYRNYPAIDGNLYRDNIQEFISQAAAANFNQGNTVMRNMQDQNQNLQNQMTNLKDMLSKFVNSNTASTSGSGTLPSNTITNPKVDLKGITTRSGVAYQGPTIPTTTSSPPKVVECEPERTH